MLLTGNEYIAIPEIEEGKINSLNFLHMGAKGIIEICGGESPLFDFSFSADGRSFSLKAEQESYWIPVYEGSVGDVSCQLKFFAPCQHRGFVSLIRLKSSSTASVRVDIRFAPEKILHTVNESKEFKGSSSVYSSGWSSMPVFELMNGFPFAAFAPLSDYTESWTCSDNSFSFSREFQLDAGADIYFPIYWGLGQEEVGAVTSAREMERWGYEALADSLHDYLNRIIIRNADKRVEKLLNYNLLFCLFYSTGLTLDTEERVSVTSRSPMYYVSAAYWDRDSMLWAFPAICEADLKVAHEILMYAAGRQGRNVGIHSRYIDGTVLEPGFELDELVAPIIALDIYIRRCGSAEILEEASVDKLIRKILQELSVWKSERLGLYGTFLQPTDDMRRYPYLCYDNVLVCKAMRILADWDWHGNRNSFEAEADRLSAAVHTHFIKGKGSEAEYIWSCDEDGSYDIYDEPPGSLMLLPFYDFCSVDDPVFLNTVRRITDPSYEYSFSNTPFAAIGCPHAPHPWVLSMCNVIRVFNDKAMLERLLSAEMDSGLACESVDENSGVCTTGRAFATCAGYLSYTLIKEFEVNG